jgi:hypothetical protein
VVLLRGELVTGVVSTLAHLLARPEKLVSGAVRESLCAHRGKHVAGLQKLQAGVDPSVLATQPFGVAQPSPS